MRVPSTNGVTLEVHDLGGDGPAALVCHATGFCARTYDALAARLAGRLHVWAVDFRGHGDSTPPADGDFDWRGMGEDVLAAVDAVGARAVHGFGHSMGGAALLLAELARPGVLRSAFLYEPIVYPGDRVAAGGPNPLADGSRRRRASFPSRGDALLRYATRPGLDRLRSDALASYVTHGFRDEPGGTVALKCEPESEARTFEAAKLGVDRLASLALPAVVGRGAREGEAMPAVVAASVAAAIAGARLRTYAHLGHFGPLQDPETVAEDVLALVDEVEGA